MAKSAGDLRAIDVCFAIANSRCRPLTLAWCWTKDSSLDTRNAGERQLELLGISLRRSATGECCKLPYWEPRMEMEMPGAGAGG
jgi:hypothetical protein